MKNVNQQQHTLTLMSRMVIGGALATLALFAFIPTAFAATPTVESSTSGNSGGNVTSSAITLPSGVTTGDLLVVVFTLDGTAAPSGISNGEWTAIDSGASSGNYQVIYWKIADGTDSLTVNHSNEGSAFASYRISGYGENASGNPLEVATRATGASANPNPPSITPSWGSADTLYMVAYSWDGNNAHSAYPTNYSSNQQTSRWVQANGAGVAAATYASTGSTEDPGTATIGGSDEWVAQTIAIAPPLPFTISGTVYSDQGTTQTTDSLTIQVAVGTSSPAGVYSTTTDSGAGTWHIDIPSGHGIDAGTPLTVWVDASTTMRASLTTKASSTSNITGLDLYKDFVILRHEGDISTGTSTRLADLAIYDYSDDTDIMFDANTTNNTLETFDGTGIYLWPNNVFLPDALVTIHGSFIASTSAIYGASSTRGTIFNATSTGFTITGGMYLGSTTFDGVGGGWSFTDASATTSNLTLRNGTLTTPSGGLYIIGDYVNSGGTLTATNNLYMYGDSMSGTLTGTSDLGNLTIDAGGSATGTWATTSPPTSVLNDVHFADDLFVAVGTGASVWTSPDAITWTQQNSGSGNFQAVAYGTSTFVAVNNAGTIYSSSDAVTWSSETIATTSTWQAVTYGEGLFVALACASGASVNCGSVVATGTRIATSPDGSTWTLQNALDDNDVWTDITYGNGLFVAVGQNSNNSDRIMYSPDAINWYAADESGFGSLWRFQSVAYGNGRFVAINAGGTNAIVSSNGRDWEAYPILSDHQNWKDVSYGHDEFIAVTNCGVAAVQSSGECVATSPDGVTWTTYPTDGFDDDWRGVTYGNGIYVAAGNSTLTSIMYSTAKDSVTFANNASTTDLTITNGEITAPTSLTVGGDFVQNATFDANGGTVYVASSSDQVIEGTFTGSSALNNLVLSGGGEKGLVFTASTTDLTIDSTVGTTTLPFILDISGDYTDASDDVFISHGANLIFSGNSAQAISGDFTTQYQNDRAHFIFRGSGTKTLSSNASTSRVTIDNGATLAAPVTLEIAREFENNGTFTGAGGTMVMGDAEGWQPVASTTTNYLQVKSLTSEINDRIAAIRFTPDGKTMFIADSTQDDIQKYTLGTAWDVSTASAVGAGVAPPNIGTDPESIAFRPDGRYLYILRKDIGDIAEYELTTPWDVSTAIETGATTSNPINSHELRFSSDGTKMYFTQSIYIEEYELSEPWAIETKGTRSYRFDPKNSAPYAIVFSPDGTNMYVNRYGSQTHVQSFALSTPWDLSTAATTTGPFYIGEQISSFFFSMEMSPDGKNLYAGELAGVEGVYQYTIDESPQVLSGSSTFTGTSALNNVVFAGTTSKAFAVNASTSDLTINADSGWVTLPSNLTISGDLTDNAAKLQVLPQSKLYFSSTSAQTIDADFTGSNSKAEFTFSGAGTKTFSNNASTTNFTIDSGATVVAPSVLTIDGVYENNGTFTAGSGLVYLTGTAASGTLTGTSAFNDVVIKPSSDGTQWASSSYSTSSEIPEITYGDDKFVLGAAYGDKKFSYSTDGITWTEGTYTGVTGVYGSITYGNGMYVAVNGGGDIATSSDGITWTEKADIFGSDEAWRAVAYGAGKFVAVSNAGDYRTMYSYDGSTWIAGDAAGNDDGWFGLTYGDGRFVAVGTGGDFVMYSDDGITWSTSSVFNATNDVVYGEGTFVAVGNGGNKAMYSTDRGENWTTLTPAGGNDPWNSVTYGNGIFVAVGDSQEGTTDAIMYSDDGITWTVPNDPWSSTNLDLNSVAYGDGKFVAGGFFLEDPDIIYSATGTFSFIDNASTTDLTIPSTAGTTTMPTELSIKGDYTNNSVYPVDFGSGTTTFNGTGAQTATGTLSSNASFYNLAVNNTWGNGTSTYSVTFGNDLTTTNTMTMSASSSALFAANATATFQNVNWNGTADAPIYLGSTDANTQWILDIPGSQLNVNYVEVQDSDATPTSGGVTASNSTDWGNNTNWNFGALETGTTTLADHDATQVSNAFNFQNKTNEALFAFKLTPNTRAATTTNIVFSLSGVKLVNASDFSAIRLYEDADNDGEYDVTDTQVAGSGVMEIDGQSGSITFTTDFLTTEATNYIVVADWNYPEKNSLMTIDLSPSNVTAIDSVGTVSVSGDVNDIQHNRIIKGGGGGTAAVGTPAPAGDGIVTGGGSDGGAGGGAIDTNTGGGKIGAEPDYNWPTAHNNPGGAWTNPDYAYDRADGTYATTSTVLDQDYTDFAHGVPGSDSIQGIAVKLEISGTTGAGDISVQLSWDGGSTFTAAKTTPTLTTTDTVVTLGGPSDKWGRTWTASEFSDANFELRLTGNPSSNNIRVDAIQVKVYHQASGGGSGGGGGGGAI